MKKILVCIIAVLITIAMTGCFSGNDPKNQDEEIVDISIENIILMGKNGDISDIEEAINKITVPEIGCRVKIVDCAIGDHEDLMKKIKAGLEQIDLVETGLTTSLSVFQAEGMLYPLDKLLDERGTKLKEKAGKLLAATTIDGKIYAYPANLYVSGAQGIGYNSSLAEKYGIHMPENLNLEAITEIGRQIKNQDPEMYLTVQNGGDLTAFNFFYDVIKMGSDFSFGGIFDPVHSTEVVNVYESEEFREYCTTIKTWYDEGLIPDDSLISGRNTQDMFNNEEVFLQVSSVSPATEMQTKKKNLSFEEKFIAMTPNITSTAGCQEFAWGITKSCKNPEKAVELLELIYTNGELANLLQYGIEGIDYEKVGENSIRTLTDDNGKIRYSTYFTAYGDPASKYTYYVDTDITVDDIINNSDSAQPIKAFGYTFKTENLNMQIQKVQNVIDDYIPILENGMADDVNEFLDEFISELKSAGIEKIITENQRQLDEWLANQ